MAKLQLFLTGKETPEAEETFAVVYHIQRRHIEVIRQCECGKPDCKLTIVPTSGVEFQCDNTKENRKTLEIS